MTKPTKKLTAYQRGVIALRQEREWKSARNSARRSFAGVSATVTPPMMTPFAKLATTPR